MLLNFLKAKIKGKMGEWSVAYRLWPLTWFDRALMINNYAVTINDTSTQIDHILINHYGIFAIETKNFIGKIYGFEDAENWKKYVHGHKQPYEFYNPIKQNEKHVKNLRRIINDDNINFTSIVVFSD
jgi:hypothetical protein